MAEIIRQVKEPSVPARMAHFSALGELYWVCICRFALKNVTFHPLSTTANFEPSAFAAKNAAPFGLARET